MHMRHIHVNSLYSGISDWLWMRFQLGEVLGMTSAICTNRFSQNKPSVFKVCLLYFQRISFRLCRSHVAWLLNMGRAKRICYLSPMRAAKVQASLRIRAVSPEPPLLAHTSSESRGTFRQKARSIAPLNGWACAVEICHDGMLEDTNSLGEAHIYFRRPFGSANLP